MSSMGMDDSDRSTGSDTEMGRRDFLGSLVGAGAAISVPASAATERVLAGPTDATHTVTSPNGSAAITFKLVDGTPYYTVSYNGTQPLNDSTLGFEFANQANLDSGFEVTGTTTHSNDTTWQPVWGALLNPQTVAGYTIDPPGLDGRDLARFEDTSRLLAEIRIQWKSDSTSPEHTVRTN